MIVCAATNNAGKLKELRRILTRCGHEVKSLRELGVTLDGGDRNHLCGKCKD